MEVFVLGATGYIGSAIASHLRDADHSVVALARSERSAEILRARSDEAVIGDLLDLDVLRQGASHADAVIDTAVAKDWELSTEALTAAVDTVIEALPEGAPFILTTGAGLYGGTAGGIVTEDASRSPLPMLAHLPAVEDVVLGAQRIRGIVVRPTMVYGNGGSIAVTSQLEQIRARRWRSRLPGRLAMSADISNERAEELFGWKTQRTGLIEDLTTGSYRNA